MPAPSESMGSMVCESCILKFGKFFRAFVGARIFSSFSMEQVEYTRRPLGLRRGRAILMSSLWVSAQFLMSDFLMR